jgi:ABC-type transporter Mla MlaB component
MRIELRSQTEGEVVLRVAGWVDNPALVEVLGEEVDSWLEQGRRVVLELEGLKGLCPAGLALLHSWQGRPCLPTGRPVELRRLPRLIASLVEVLHGCQGPSAPPCRPLAPALQPLPAR